MQHMLARYEKTGSIRGTAAFDEFLRWRGEGGGERECEGDLTVPVRDSAMGVDLGARQAIIMGYPEEEFQGSLRKGLGGLEKDIESRRW